MRSQVGVVQKIKLVATNSNSALTDNFHQYLLKWFETIGSQPSSAAIQVLNEHKELVPSKELLEFVAGTLGEMITEGLTDALTIEEAKQLQVFIEDKTKYA
ncbi:hypothetical protein OH460_08365 [Vibrio sp. Makdt]|uniref:hypothetical protein n=1 Tax=Vibrio sp. Makdt TaxID=2998828 RepID=UPI0022CD67A9|nr:hypothetical protein [Vibrio sp. Makdt]MDA0152313.1 hypothetical protein [Vibrio sp. Makdt]